MKKRYYSTGFTLVEIMVVLAIIGTLVGLATISVSGVGERELRQEANRMLQLMRIAYEDAEIYQKDIAISLKGDKQYEFYEFSDQDMSWVPSSSEYLHPRTLGEFYEIELELFDHDMDTDLLYEGGANKADDGYAEAAAEFDKEEEIFEPDILFFSDGQLTPFEIRLSHEKIEDEVYIIYGESLAGVGMIRDD